MSDVIDWSKAPEWADKHGFTGLTKTAVWFNCEKYSYVDGQQDGKAFFYCDACTYSSQYFSNVTFRPITPSWSGEGLPPVGTVCEMQDCQGSWVNVTIIANHAGFAHGWDSVHECAHFSPHVCEFRPIRTPEQIAADEREAAIGKMVQAIYLVRCGLDCTPLSPADEAKCASAALYDAGYRKP